ncbi:DsbA family protein [Gallaecimonas pentaromativorans]|uniref:DsbA family protein n=1 Tax=Gallaecimonas pentaromativorans TaxID=584787 RepID=UPI003A90430D
MNTATLHYLYDPFCGWCYGAAPMVSAASEIEGLAINAHGYGLVSGPDSKLTSPQWRDFVRPHEERITAYSKQIFSPVYLQNVLESTEVRLDSDPPIAAMMAAEALGGLGVAMLKRLQLAYYQQGRPIAEFDELLKEATALGLDQGAFEAAYSQALGQVDSHINDTRAMVGQLGLRGVPGFALEQDGQWQVFPFGHYLSRPALFKADLQKALQGRAE